MLRPSSNDRSVLWLHGLWALATVAAFGGGYLASWSNTPAKARPEAVHPGAGANGQPAAMATAPDSWPAAPAPDGSAAPGADQRGTGKRAPQLSPTPLLETLGTPPSLELPETTDDRLPPRGSELTPDQAHRLLSGTVLFQPSAIRSSNVPVTASTPLSVGQHVQVQWGGQWWAGTIHRLEEDGRLHIHYFGWADSWDEAKTREELQLDPSAPLQAVDTVFRRRK